MTTKTSTKTKTSAILAQKLKVQNILQFSLAQTTLQSNFKAIIQALSQHDQLLTKGQQNNDDKFGNIHNSQEKMNKQLADLRDLVNRLVNDNQNLKLQIKGIQGKMDPNPQSASLSVTSNQIQAINKQLSSLKQKTDRMQQKALKSNEAIRSDIDKLKKQLNDMKKFSELSNSNNSRLKQLQKLLKQFELRNKQMQDKIKIMEGKAQRSLENQISQNLEQMNKKIKQLSEISGNHESRIGELQKELEQQKAILQQQKRLRNKMNQQLWKIHDMVSKTSENNLSQQMNTDLLKQLKKQILQLQKKINQLSSINSKTGFNDTTTHQSPSKYNLDVKAEGGYNGDLRQQLLQKLKQLRAQLMKNMRKLDLRGQSDNGFDKNKIDSLDQAIMRLDHLMADKANLDTVKKLILNLENKINYIYNMFLGDTQEDTMIARKNWFCLSCDKKLEKYQGKVGNHLVNSQLKSKTLQQDTVGGGMVLKPSKSKLDLPKVFSSAKRQ